MQKSPKKKKKKKCLLDYYATLRLTKSEASRSFSWGKVKCGTKPLAWDSDRDSGAAKFLRSLSQMPQMQWSDLGLLFIKHKIASSNFKAR